MHPLLISLSLSPSNDFVNRSLMLICSHSKPSQTTVRMHCHSNLSVGHAGCSQSSQFQLEALLTSLLRYLPSFHLHITLGINLIIRQHINHHTQSLWTSSAQWCHLMLIARSTAPTKRTKRTNRGSNHRPTAAPPLQALQVAPIAPSPTTKCSNHGTTVDQLPHQHQASWHPLFPPSGIPLKPNHHNTW